MTNLSDIHLRITSLWRATIRLRRITGEAGFHLPASMSHREVARQIDDLCDEVERLYWRLGGRNRGHGDNQ